MYVNEFSKTIDNCSDVEDSNSEWYCILGGWRWKSKCVLSWTFAYVLLLIESQKLSISYVY